MGSEAHPQLLNMTLTVPALALLMISDLRLVSRQHLIFARNSSSPVLRTGTVWFLHRSYTMVAPMGGLRVLEFESQLDHLLAL